ncbi:hypothetical protein [Brachybacterium sp. FME24]|uniref:hypothetical protein n=1 Tax=Brachybacterium sp. FME24 TaxID=2742605 RepID=UPI001868BDD7|nr:hypothetical protein [Brachybacterium sp. FME24]
MPAPQPAAVPAAPAAPLPASPPSTATGTAASRRLLHPEVGTRPMTLWGSSSMSSEGGVESTPRPIRIHEHLSLSAAPATIHGFGVGATQSAHTLLMRGLDTPRLTVVGPPREGTSRVEVTLDSGLGPRGPIRIPGAVDGTAGILDGSSGTWSFTPEDATLTIDHGIFTSALAEIATDSRQVLWMGKNNILDVTGALHDTQRMWDAAATPEADTLVLGQWCTEFDETGSATGDAVATVNAEQSRRYGDHFLDIQELLTGQEGLHCSPLAPLALLDQATTQDALGRGVVPPLLIASDRIHLNGWGNLAVSWAIVRRMRELQWL